MVVVPGHAVGAEGQHRVGLHVGHQGGDPAYRLVLVDVGAAAVRVVEPVVLGDAEDRQRALHLRGAYGGQRGAARPALLVGGAELAAGGRDADDPVAGAAARAISPAHSQVSSSGCAQTLRMLPRGLSPDMSRDASPPAAVSATSDARQPAARAVADHGGMTTTTAFAIRALPAERRWTPCGPAAPTRPAHRWSRSRRRAANRCAAACGTRSAGEPLLLFGYRPPTADGPYREIGPVFAHAEPCRGYDGNGYPRDWLGRPQVLRAYDSRGWIHPATRVHDGSDPEAAIAAVLAEPGVVEVHSRNVAYGCFMFAVTAA